MKITLIGYGRMGHEIEKIAIDRGHSIQLIIDVDNQSDLEGDTFTQSDVAIEFSVPSAVTSNIKKCFEKNIPVVTGTTGWHDQFGEISTICNEGKHTLFHASNFSIGVNLFFAINEFTAGLMDKFPDYDLSVTETHHVHKLDAPSGTAVSLSDIILNKIKRKTSWESDSNSPEVLSVHSIREGEVTGIHEVKFDSPDDFIVLKHHAKSRKGFALGAVIAAEFIHDKTGIFTMRDLLGI